MPEPPPIQQLSADEIAEIEHEAAAYPTRQPLGLEALRIVQQYRGWVSDGALQALAHYLKVPVAELDSLATYYQLIFRQPVGREVMLLCNSASCWVMGCSRVQKHIRQQLNIGPGETTADGIFTLLETPCLGDCDKAPVMMVGTEMHRQLDSEKIDALIRALRERHHSED
ncbi:NADH-quinone oxidoreductase subunit NuoE [Microbulbifer aggregans]|uniref:NADH-quinone oxidoreductase subunit NuoE n=1 Tax=Microbulbifer aggregans TaxID=1769779 RepID=UPI001CFCC441|nr:NADH-quinone oxidoreductase subunit NuoE [Microbulbifer aggregans]